ncbi:hypothetical protein DL767_004858 [Monosporascus sp. MG133]|nr:hypothetical protein DL767_004858 [Monosporascus sp. MG133]
MLPRQVLSALALPTTALSLPAMLVRSEAQETAVTCLLVQSPTTPINPPDCWAWYAYTSEPADYCGPSSFGVISDIQPPAGWINDCTSLRNSLLSRPRDFLLADFSTERFNTLLSHGHCAFQVKPVAPPTYDPIYFGGTDLTDILRSSIQRSNEGRVGVGGSMTCYSYPLGWRVVPV